MKDEFIDGIIFANVIGICIQLAAALIIFIFTGRVSDYSILALLGTGLQAVVTCSYPYLIKRYR